MLNIMTSIYIDVGIIKRCKCCVVSYKISCIQKHNKHKNVFAIISHIDTFYLFAIFSKNCKCKYNEKILKCVSSSSTSFTHIYINVMG